ncbi:hypothetical protein CNMCM6457_008502 [Aspergillus fumigatiaffinis]|nr:hypothetical protein CNMCM6457_008502 [Aspergillus fumigatiaffinis]
MPKQPKFQLHEARTYRSFLLIRPDDPDLPALTMLREVLKVLQAGRGNFSPRRESFPDTQVGDLIFEIIAECNTLKGLTDAAVQCITQQVENWDYDKDMIRWEQFVEGMVLIDYSLPAELRIQIWHGALPEKDSPALIFFKKGCWRRRRLSETEQGYDPTDPSHPHFYFDPELLDHVEVNVPLFFVNREARRIALAWCHEQGISLRFARNQQSLIFSRPFNSKHDVLYVPLDQWDGFLCEPYDQMFTPEWTGQSVSTYALELGVIAVPEAQVYSNPAVLHEMFEWPYRPAVLYVVLDSPPDLRLEYAGANVQRRWEVRTCPGGSLFYTWKDGRGSFDGDGEHSGHGDLYKRIKEVSKGLGEGITLHNVRSFGVRPVCAVRYEGSTSFIL